MRGTRGSWTDSSRGCTRGSKHGKGITKLGVLQFFNRALGSYYLQCSNVWRRFCDSTRAPYCAVPRKAPLLRVVRVADRWQAPPPVPRFAPAPPPTSPYRRTCNNACNLSTAAVGPPAHNDRHSSHQKAPSIPRCQFAALPSNFPSRMSVPRAAADEKSRTSPRCRLFLRCRPQWVLLHTTIGILLIKRHPRFCVANSRPSPPTSLLACSSPAQRPTKNLGPLLDPSSAQSLQQAVGPGAGTGARAVTRRPRTWCWH